MTKSKYDTIYDTVVRHTYLAEVNGCLCEEMFYGDYPTWSLTEQHQEHVATEVYNELEKKGAL